MNKRMIVRILGFILIIEACFLLLPSLIGLIYRENAGWFYLYTALGAAAFGLVMTFCSRPRTKTIYAREGLVIVALSWIELSLVGALPFTLCGDIPNYVDAVFEMVSGFTTTGSSILSNVELLRHCSLFWRSFSHWIGGMGILVFMLAIVSLEGGQAIHLLRAESPGPTVSKMVPKMIDSSKILYGIYFVLTILQIVFYVCGGMPVFDALCNTFGTAGTGGFSIKAASMGAYNAYAQTVTTVFMILFGVNFSVYFFLLRKKFDLVFKNTELRWYLIIIFASIAMITVNVLPQFPSVREAIHHCAFSVASIITTTGYCTADFNLWPEFSKIILVFLMIIGACAGSTGGGMKVSRIVILAKSIANEIRVLIRPSTVRVISVDGKRVDRDTCRAVSSYMLTYAFLTVLSILLVSLDNFDGTTTVTAVFATFNNIGPGLGLVGPTGNFGAFSTLSKIVLSLDMLFGRLELYPMLVLFLPGTWRR